MIKKMILTSVLAGLLIPASAQKVPQLGKSSINEVIKAMTLDEKVTLLIGTGMDAPNGNAAVVGETRLLLPGAAGTTYPIPRLGIPGIVLADGPAGLRISPTRKGDSNTYYCTAFPVATLLACTWNTELVQNVGKAMGNEVLEYGADVLLAPALNIHRNPLCGRNFEYYSEEPLVAGKMAAAIVNGVQANGVGTSIKHLAANSQETNRGANDARMTTRALREIYLKGFEIAVKESNPWTVMSSYNNINGVYTSESRGLITDILRNEWGYKGTVMTDWFGGRNAPAQVHAGNDLLMPGRLEQKNAIIDAVNNGSLSVRDIDTNIKRILKLIIESPRFKGYKYSNKPDLKAHAAVTRESASEGMVLLKNENQALPLKSGLKNIALFGSTSYSFISGGTGSGDVNEAYVVDLEQGLENAGFGLQPKLKSVYEKHRAYEYEKLEEINKKMTWDLTPQRPEEPNLGEQFIKLRADDSDIALITFGCNSGEGHDRRLNDFELTQPERDLLVKVTNAFHAVGKKVVVVLNIAGVIETASWKNLPDAILLTWQAGQEGGNSVADILSGKVNPSGKLSMTFPVNYMDAASSANFPSDYNDDSQKTSDKTKHELVKDVDYTNYEEDVFVGYRYFDTFGKEVSYPFGYGLSYTDFSYSNATVKKKSGKFIVSVTVKNSGSVAGKEVVQLYVSAPSVRGFLKPDKELKAFSKTKMLSPNESQTLTMTLTMDCLASFNEKESAWITDGGTYQILIGASSRDIKQQLSFNVPKTVVTEKVNNVLAPVEPLNIIRK